MAEEVKTKISGEYKAIEAEYRRKVALVAAGPKLEIAGWLLWAVADGVLLLILIFGVFTYIVSGSFSDARTSAGILSNAVTSHLNIVRTAPTGLAIQDAKSVSVTSGKYDLFVTVQNPNAEWFATFDYVFVFDGGQTEPAAGFVNPGDNRLISIINVPIDHRPSGLRLVMSNLTWQRVDKHVIPDVNTFLETRQNITVEEATYFKDVVIGSEQFGRTTLVLKNRTAYAYWEPKFLVKLMRGSTVVSLTEVSVPKFLAGETRTMEVRWFGEVPPSGTIAVEPEIFYFDSGVYMNPDDEVGQSVQR